MTLPSESMTSDLERGGQPGGMGRERVLLLMADSPLRVAVQACLADAGFEVTHAADAAAALSACADQDADVVLAALAAGPGEAAFAEIEHLLHRSRWRPLVLIVDRSRPQAVEQAVVHGALAVVLIDAGPEQLLAAVEVALARGLELASLRDRAERLAGALEERRETGLALGICMARYGVSREEALKMLCARARRSGSSPEVLVKEMLDAWERGLLPRLPRRPRRRRR